MRSMLVIGLGRFGTHLAKKLAKLNNEVMVIDQDEAAVEKVEPYVTQAQIGDCADEEVLRALGVRNFDICFVCISDNFQSSLEITCLLKELGAKYVVSKADREIHAKFLMKVGADSIVHPERDMAQRTAARYSAKNVFSYTELSDEYAISEVKTPGKWVGKSIREVNVRSVHDVNIIGVKRGNAIQPLTDPSYIFQEDEHLVVAGEKDNLLQVADMD